MLSCEWRVLLFVMVKKKCGFVETTGVPWDWKWKRGAFSLAYIWNGLLGQSGGSFSLRESNTAKLNLRGV